MVDKTANPHLSFLLPTKRRGAKYFEHNAASLRSREEVGDVLTAKEPGYIKVFAEKCICLEIKWKNITELESSEMVRWDV